MERIAVKSTNLKSVGYDSKRKILEIQFHNNRIYHYLNVPLEIYKGLISAESKGRYHHKNIVNKFQYRKGEA